jgi:hypothetical protein
LNITNFLGNSSSDASGGLIGTIDAFDGSVVISDIFINGVLQGIDYLGGLIGASWIQNTKFSCSNIDTELEIAGDYCLGGVFSDIYSNYPM